MWLTRSSLPELASAVVRPLIDQELIETELPSEVNKDMLAVFEQYLRDEQELAAEARQVAQKRGIAPSDAGRIKRELAKTKGIGLGEEAIDYLLNQLVEMLMHSGSVEEIFGEDHQLKLAMRGPIRTKFQSSDEVEDKVRKRMKHMQEGTSAWEIEYQRMKEEVSRRS